MTQPETLEVLIHATSQKAAEDFRNYLLPKLDKRKVDPVEHHGGNNYGVTVHANHNNNYWLQTEVESALESYLQLTDDSLSLSRETMRFLESGLFAKVKENASGKGVNPHQIYAEAVRKIEPQEELHRVAIELHAGTGAMLEMRSMLHAVLSITPEQVYEQRSEILRECGLRGTRPEDNRQFQLLTKIRDGEFDAVRELATRTGLQVEQVQYTRPHGDYHTGQISLLHKGSDIVLDKDQTDKAILVAAVNTLREMASEPLLSHTVLEVNGLPASQDSQYKVIGSAQKTLRELQTEGLLSAEATVKNERSGAYDVTAARISSPAFEDRENRNAAFEAVRKELKAIKDTYDPVWRAEKGKILLGSTRLLNQNKPEPSTDVVILFSRDITPQRKDEILGKINTALSKVKGKAPDITMGEEFPLRTQEPFLQIEFGETVAASTRQTFEQRFKRAKRNKPQLASHRGNKNFP